MNTYYYSGPVMEFDRCITDKWEGSTRAVSEKKARANLTYQYKVSNGKAPRSKITLPGKLIIKD